MFSSKKIDTYKKYYQMFKESNLSCFIFCKNQALKENISAHTIMNWVRKGKEIFEISEKEEKIKDNEYKEKFFTFIDLLLSYEKDFIITLPNDYLINFNRVVFVCGFSIANEIKADRSEKVYVYRKDAKVKEIKKEQLYSLVKDYNFFDFCNKVKNILI